MAKKSQGQGQTRRKSSPKKSAATATAVATEELEEQSPAVAAPEGVEDFEVPAELDFGIELVDEGGRSATIPLAARRPLYPQVDPVLYKLDRLSGSQVSEPTFHRYVFSFAEWQAENPELDLTSLHQIRFRFPLDTPASIWLDDIAISPQGL